MAEAHHIRFEWDDAKNERCLRDRGFGFADILPAFLDPDRRVERDDRRDYGEERFRVYGRATGTPLCDRLHSAWHGDEDYLRSQGKCSGEGAVW